MIACLLLVSHAMPRSAPKPYLAQFSTSQTQGAKTASDFLCAAELATGFGDCSPEDFATAFAIEATAACASTAKAATGVDPETGAWAGAAGNATAPPEAPSGGKGGAALGLAKRTEDDATIHSPFQNPWTDPFTNPNWWMYARGGPYGPYTGGAGRESPAGGYVNGNWCAPGRRSARVAWLFCACVSFLA
jgi:hypothetical protein